MTYPTPDAGDLRDRIAALEAHVDRLDGLVDHLYVTLGVRGPGAPTGFDPLHDPRVLQEVQAGRMIAAIKTYRDITGVGLAEAKAAVESLRT